MNRLRREVERILANGKKRGRYRRCGMVMLLSV